MEDKKQTAPGLEPLITAQQISQAIEAILFAAGHPMRYDKLAEVLSLSVKDVKTMVREMETREHTHLQNSLVLTSQTATIRDLSYSKVRKLKLAK